MSAQRDANPQLFDAFLKSAQYIVRLKSQQDVWDHLAKLIVTHFPATWIAFARRDGVQGICLHHSTLPDELAGEQILGEEVRRVIGEVLDSGFLASHVIAVPTPSMTALLPIVEEYQAKEVMLIGHQDADPLPKELLDVYLAVAGLAGTAFERLHSERELNRHRANLEELVQDRTAELAQAKRQNELILNAVREGICGVDLEGRITFVNPCAAKLIGWEAAELIGRSAHNTFHYARPDGCSYPVEECILHTTLTRGEMREVSNEQFVRRDGTRFPVEFRTAPIIEEGKLVGAVIVFQDITERKRAEAHQALLTDILKVLNRGGDLHSLITETLRLVRRATGFEAVGLRLRQGEDCPYFQHDGFSEEFLREENFLCERGGEGVILRDAEGRVVLECTCGLVLAGRTDPTMPCFTEGGSFWTNVSNELLALPRQSDPRINPRNRCIHSGYQSVGLFPVRAGREIIGLLQLNDCREGRFTPELIAFYEALAQNIGLARQRMAAEAALREQAALLDLAHDAIIVRGTGDKVVYWNRGAEQTYGWTPEEAMGQVAHDLLKTRFPKPLAELEEEVAEMGHWEGELTHSRKDGQVIVAASRWAVQRDESGHQVGVLEINRDITDRNRAEERIKAALGEKEVLLKEIHHRVKNNMQVISSLVALQAERLPDASMRDVLHDVTDRVRSMALVHEKLYQSSDMARVDFAEYIQSLLGYLWRAHGTAASGVRLSFNLEPVQLSVNAAVPCGLILNELATNALKHAFHGRSDAEVVISLRATSEGGVCLCVRDNGTGLPPGLDWRQANSLGLRIVQILAGQLRATVEVSSGEGTEFTVTFGKQKT